MGQLCGWPVSWLYLSYAASSLFSSLFSLTYWLIVIFVDFIVSLFHIFDLGKDIYPFNAVCKKYFERLPSKLKWNSFLWYLSLTFSNLLPSFISDCLFHPFFCFHLPLLYLLFSRKVCGILRIQEGPHLFKEPGTCLLHIADAGYVPPFLPLFLLLPLLTNSFQLEDLKEHCPRVEESLRL